MVPAPRAVLTVLGIVLGIVLAATLSACSSDAGPAADAGVLRLAVPEPRLSLRPTDFVVFSLASYGIAEQLVRSQPDGTMQPWLLESYERTDPTTWRLRVRPGVRFHNGNPVDAAAVVAALREQAAANKASDSIGAGTLAVTGPAEFTVTTPQPAATLLDDLGNLYRNYVIYDVAALDRAGDDAAALVAAGIFTGPFRPESVSDRKIVATRFDGYWGRRPQETRVEVLSVDDPAARVAAVRNGEADIALEPPASAALAADDRTLFYRRADVPNRAVYAQFNLIRAPFDDPLVRQAFLLAIDYRELVEGPAVGGVYQVARSIYPDALPFTEPVQRTDTARAAALFTEAAWVKGPDGIRARGGVPLRVDYQYEAGQPDHEAIGVSLRDQLRPLGIDVALRTVDDAYDSEAWPRDWTMTVVNLQFDGSNPTEVLAGYLGDGFANAGRATSARLIELIEALRITEPRDRSDALREVQREVARGGLAVSLAFRGADLITGARYADIRPDPQSLLFAPSGPEGR